jgi:uncharacterized protein YjeT (DUF2065 family)
MNRAVKAIAKFLYGFFGGLFLIAGISVLLLGTGLLPETVKNIITNVARGDSNTLHIIQELGSILVFVGLITVWFIRHYEHSKPFHWAMTTFLGLFALVHWFDTRGDFHWAVGPMINTIPFILFVSVGLLRKYSERSLEAAATR